MGVFKFIFKSVTTPKKNGGGEYNMSTGVIKHPPKGKKAPKVKGKMKRED